MSEWFNIREENKPKVSDTLNNLLNIQYTSEKELLQSWIDVFVVKDGIDKTINEFQSELFRSVFWEIYLNKAFIELGFDIDQENTSPDFLLSHQDIKGKIAVEAVIANFPQDKKSNEKNRTLEDVYGENNIYEIVDESIPRITNSINSKSKLYKEKYCKKSEISSAPYIVALHDYSQNKYGQVSFYSMLCVLYAAMYDPEDKLDLKILCEDNFDTEYKYRESFIKSNGSEIRLGLFCNNEYSHISGVLFSHTLSLGKLTSLCESHFPLDKFIITERLNGVEIFRYSNSEPDETILDGLFLFINPFAKNSINVEPFISEGMTIISYDEHEGISIDCNSKFLRYRSPLIRRKVGMKGTERDLIGNFDDFSFIPVVRTDSFD